MRPHASLIRFTDRELATVQAAAARSGVKLAEFCRVCAVQAAGAMLAERQGDEGAELEAVEL